MKKYSVTYIDVNNTIPFKDVDIEVADAVVPCVIVDRALSVYKRQYDERFAKNIQDYQEIILDGLGDSFLFNLEDDEGVFLVRRQS